MSRRSLGAAGTLVLFAGICAAQTAVVSDAVLPFQLVNKFLIVVQVHIGDYGPYRFMVDTGASISVIDSRLAKELDLARGGRAEMLTPTRAAKVELAELPLVMAGYVGVKNLPVAIQPLHELHDIDPQTRGVLGSNFFSRFDYQLDYRYNQIVIDLDHTRTEMLAGERLALRHDCDDDSDVLEIAVHAREKLFPSKLRLKLDSGSPVGAVFSRQAKARAELSGTASYRAINDSGSTAGQLATAEVAVGQQVFPAVSFLLMDDRYDKACFDGLLPESLLKNVYVSHSGGFAIVQPFEY